MRQRLIYILKHNAAIQYLYRVVMGFVFRIWGRFIRTDENLVLFVSFMGMGFNDSPKAIYEFLQKHPEYSKFRCIWAFEIPEKYPELQTVTIASFAPNAAQAATNKYQNLNTGATTFSTTINNHLNNIIDNYIVPRLYVPSSFQLDYCSYYASL